MLLFRERWKAFTEKFDEPEMVMPVIIFAVCLVTASMIPGFCILFL